MKLHGVASQETSRSGDLSSKRLARVAVGVLIALAVTAACAIFLTPEPQSAVLAADSCVVSPPEPGPARPWESEIAVSTYSTVNTRTRNLFTAIPIVSWSGRGPDMNMVLYHNAANVGLPSSRSDNVGFDLGPGWSIAYSDQLLFDDPINPTQITVVQDNGTEDVFTWDAVTQEWTPPVGLHDKLTFDASHGAEWTVTHKDQSRHVFRRQPLITGDDGIFRLAGVFDATGAATTITYERIGNTPKYRIKEITAADRKLQFAYDPTNGKLHTITDPEEPGEGGVNGILPTRSWSFVYGASGWGRLERIEDAMGFLNRFAYDADGRLSVVSDKTDNVTGNPPPGESYRFAYFADGGLSTVTDPDDPTDPNDGLTQSFISTGCDRIWLSPGVFVETTSRHTSYYDRRGSRVDYVYSGAFPVQRPDGNLTKIKTYMAQTVVASRFEYDSDRNLISAYDEINHGWTATYDDRGNMLVRGVHVTGLRGWFYRWQYDNYNNVTQYTDPAYHTTRFLYEDLNYPTLLTSIIEPPDRQGNTAITTLDYDWDNQLSKVIDPNGVITRFEYDAFGQPSRYAEGVVDLGSGPSDVFYETYVYDGGSRMTKSGGSAFGCGGGGVATGCTGGGTTSHDAAGNATGSSCIYCRQGGSAVFAPTPGIKLPWNVPDLPEVSATFVGATYNAMRQPLSLPVEVFVTPPAGQIETIPRGRTFEYDNLGRVTLSSTGGAAFSYAYTNAGGTITRTGPDGVDTVVTLDVKGRVNHMRRGPAGASLVEARYEYFDNDLLRRVTQFNADGTTVNGSVEYDYYDNNLVHDIRHLNNFGFLLTRYEYVYDDIGAPASITEYDATDTAAYVTTFAYDNRGRLIEEKRVHAIFGGYDYWYAYEYDAGGNRKMKLDHAHNKEWRYTYDLDDPAAYGTANNRLMMVEEYTGQGPGAVLSKTNWYFYNCAGNVTRVVSRDESVAAELGNGGGLSGSAKHIKMQMQTTKGGGAAQVPPGGCPAGSSKYTATRFGYALNGQSVTLAMGEAWCWDESLPNSSTTDYQVIWAHEFLSDGARQRFLDIEFDPAALTSGTFTEVARTQTKYDGDQPYRSTYTDLTTGAYTETGYELGLAKINDMAAATTTYYYHTDMLGTTRFMTNATSEMGELASYTAFGERVTGTPTRFGYVGAFGYQTAGSSPGDPFVSEMPYQHVGARYYDPTTGRFLQRDPIGIRGGLNVYAYVGNISTIFVDPTGLNAVGDFFVGVGVALGGISGAMYLSGNPAAVGASRAVAAAGGISGALGCAINWVFEPPPPPPPPSPPWPGRDERYPQDDCRRCHARPVSPG